MAPGGAKEEAMAQTIQARTAKARSEVKRLADLVRREIDDGATTVEEIHKSIANLPLDFLGRLDVFQETVKGVRKIQDASIGAIYDLIRKVNREVGRLAVELLESRTARRAQPKKTLKKAAKSVKRAAASAHVA
jgi:hypothetical protein